jgi:hypothetical protein
MESMGNQTAESLHSTMLLIAGVNTRRGSKSYVGSFELANYMGHAQDMYFFFGGVDLD